MNQIFYCFQMIRPLNVLLSGITVFIAAYLINQNNYALICIISIVVMSFCSFGNIINDLFDVNTDKINKPQKYFLHLKLNASYMVEPYEYIILMILSMFFIIPLIIAHIYFPENAVYYLYSISFLIIIYTPYLKGIPLIGNLIISFILSSVFIITELTLVNSFSGLLFYPVLLTFLLTLIRELAKDIDDLKGDVNARINTFPVAFGINYSKYLLSILTMILIIISIYPYFIGLYNFLYLILLVLLVQIPLIGCIFYLWKYPNFQTCVTLTITTKYITIGGVVTILSTKLLN